MNSVKPTAPEAATSLKRLAWIVGIMAFLLAAIFVLRPGPRQKDVDAATVTNRFALPTITHFGRGLGASRLRPSHAEPGRPPEEIVAEKLGQFARGHEQIVAAIAKRFDVAIPAEVNRFFAAVQSGRWEETTNLFALLHEIRMSTNQPPGFEKLWPAILETYGVAEQTHAWPAQQLLDYGNAVLDSLRPGMVYVGGTDAGRFIPTLLNETGDSPDGIVLTQNALADGSYLDFLQFRYGDRFNALSTADSQQSFQTYLADAQKRLQHDQEFPNELRQVRPGEDIRVTDGRVQVSGQVAVMMINEQLVQTLLQKNPNLSFALEESFPLKSFYADATTLGPITELHATDAASALTADRAALSLDYWRSTVASLPTDTDSASATARDAYAKLILGQANLFLDRKLTTEAEQAYQLANSLCPAQPEAVFSYISLLMQNNRAAEARQVAQTAVDLAPDNRQFRDLLEQLKRK